MKLHCSFSSSLGHEIFVNATFLVASSVLTLLCTYFVARNIMKECIIFHLCLSEIRHMS